MIINDLRQLVSSLLHNPIYIAQAIANRSALQQTLKYLQAQYSFDWIIDVGANIGDFSKQARRFFPKSKIIAFKPIEQCCKIINETFVSDDQFSLVSKAVGEKEGFIQFNINQHMDSSSILNTSILHNNTFSFASATTPTKVKVTTLDTELKNKKIKNGLLKLDIQGYEDRALQGGKQILPRFQVIICEINFANMYINQASFHTISTLLHNHNLIFSGMINIAKNPSTGQIISGDSLFIRDVK